MLYIFLCCLEHTPFQQFYFLLNFFFLESKLVATIEVIVFDEFEAISSCSMEQEINNPFLT